MALRQGMGWHRVGKERGKWQLYGREVGARQGKEMRKRWKRGATENKEERQGHHKKQRGEKRQERRINGRREPIKIGNKPRKGGEKIKQGRKERQKRGKGEDMHVM